MKNYSVSIFGSSTRTDFDKYSDKDLLVVAEDIEQLEKLKQQYIREGWSVSAYTYSKLSYISRIGGLFIEHLRNEGEIIHDNYGRLKEILDSHISKENYNEELVETSEFFDVLKVIPKTKIAFAWFCDTFFVGLRNHLIYENASKGIYVFSYIGLLEILVKDGRINESDYNILKELRVVKRNYREGIKDELPSIKYVNEVLRIANKLGFVKGFVFQSNIEYQKHIELNLLTSNYTPYQKLRLIESYYITKEIVLPKLKKIISNPQFYACKMKDDNYTLGLIRTINSSNNNTQQKLKNHSCFVPCNNAF